MDHEVGKSASSLKLLKVVDYPSWKERFENFARFSDIRMWLCITDGYVAPFVEFEGSEKVTSYSAMKDEDKRMYEAENKALAAITMCLPQEILHTFSKYRTAKELWQALENWYEGNVQVRKGRIKLLKAQFMVFRYMKNESLEDVITRFYHLMTELDYSSVTYTDTEKNDKLLDALPPKWDLYTVILKENEHYSEWDLETIIGKLRAYDLNMQRKETISNMVQDPSIYHGKKSSSNASSSGGVTTFYTGEEELGNLHLGTDDTCAYIASSGGNGKGENSSGGNSAKGHRSMPMSTKSAEGHLAMLASLVASYENYVQGKISDPALLDEDYDQIDPDDLEEMDLQWQLAMVARRAKRFMNRTGRSFVGGKTGFDKSKVKCYSCQGFGHFARECQRPRQHQNQNQNNTSTRPNYFYQTQSSGSSVQTAGNQGSGNNFNSRALVVQQQDGTYDWGVHMEEQGQEAQAFMAEITEEAGISEEMVQILSEDDSDIAVKKLETEEHQSEAELNGQENWETKVVIEETDSEVKGVESELFKLELPDDIDLEEIVGYMADLEAPQNQKVDMHDPNAKTTITRIEAAQKICKESGTPSNRKSYIVKNEPSYSPALIALLFIIMAILYAYLSANRPNKIKVTL